MILSFYLTLTAFLVLGSRIATFLHELLGHACIALIFGGSINKIQISMFGGGRVWADLMATHKPALFIFSMSGILINLLTGAGSFIIAVKRRHLSFQSRLFLTVFALTSILGALAYLITGIYYDFGDPVTWTDTIPGWYGVLWLPLMSVTPFAAYIIFRYYASLQEHVFHTSGFVSRSVYAALTLGFALITYLVFFIVTQQNLASVTASEEAFIREKERIFLEKQDALFTEIQQQHPELTAIEVQAMVDKTPIQIKTEDIPKKFPILPLLIGLCASGGMAALIKAPDSAEIMNDGPDLRQALIYGLAAFAVVLILAYSGELVYLRR